VRIPTLESDLSQLKSAGLDPKVLALIEKLAAQPLLIQKLNISGRAGLTLSPDKSNLLSQVQLPLKTADRLSFLTQTSANVTLTTKNNLFSLLVTPRPTLPSNPPNQPSVELLFKQAKLIQNSILRLTQLVQMPTQYKSSSVDTRQGAIAKTVTPNQSASPAPITSTNQPEIKQAVSDLLKSRPTIQPALSESLTAFFGNSKSLLKSFNTQMSSRLQGQNTVLKTPAITELVTKLQNFSPNASNVKALSSLLTSIEQLRSLIDFSANNRQLSVARRLQSSGNFFESKLKSDVSANKTLPAPSNFKVVTDTSQNLTFTPETKPTQYQASNKSGEGKNNQTPNPADIKQLGLQIRQAIRAILAQLNQPDSASLNNLKLLSQLVQHSSFQQALQTPPTQAEPIPPVTHSVTSDGDELTSPAKLLFQNKVLQKLPWQSLINTQGRTLNLSKDMDFSLLNTQRQLLGEMLSDINTMLNKIETNQLLSLRNESSLLAQYLIELPIYRAGSVDSFEIMFEGHQKDKDRGSNKVWTVTIRFDLEPLGPMFARVKLKGERISTHFFAEDLNTAKLLNQHLSHLEQSLFSAGVDIDEIKGLQGIIPDTLMLNDEQTIDVRV